jgi:hypothetical protein
VPRGGWVLVNFFPVADDMTQNLDKPMSSNPQKALDAQQKSRLNRWTSEFRSWLVDTALILVSIGKIQISD